MVATGSILDLERDVLYRPLALASKSLSFRSFQKPQICKRQRPMYGLKTTSEVRVYENYYLHIYNYIFVLQMPNVTSCAKGTLT